MIKKNNSQKSAEKQVETSEQQEKVADEVITPEQMTAAEEQMREQIRDEIQTADQLKAAYPELAQQIIDERTAQLEDFFSNRTAAQIKEHFPPLYARLVDAQKGTVPDLKVPGFVLTLTDPFAAGTLRTFAFLSGQSGLQLPFMLPFKKKHSAAAIKGYIIRAEGGGDYERAKAARGALKKCK